ncbi:MAG: hypothetical protein A2W17_04850 [Planctomycetes bacterium RBG_16_41_13]|nr:MAG: hypothetical protein A2W17_04850 [Planctomycetes bacterium RBG_16_41_13]
MAEKIGRIAEGPSFLTNPKLSLVCFGGKGGVGKTTSAAAAALYLADTNPQKRILLASIDPAHSLMDSLLVADTFKNLMVWEIDAQASFQKFMVKHGNTLERIMERGTFLDDEDISALLSTSLPGIDELMGMVELVDLLENDAYDVIVLDTAPTGHAIKFLQMPHLIKKWTRLLDLMMEKYRYMSKLYARRYRADDTDAFIKAFSSGAKRVERILRNASCEFVPVLLPEALSVNETKRFLSTLEKQKIPVKNIIVNRINPFGNCSFCNEQYLLQKKYIDEIKRCFAAYNVLLMPLYKDEIHGRESLLMFARAMADADCLNHSAANRITPPLSFCTKESAGRENGDLNPSPVAISPPLPFPAAEEASDREIKESANHFPIPKSTIKLLMFGGKGGVGKTTIAGATALFLSEAYPEKRILLFSADPAHSLSDCLDVTMGNDRLHLKNNLYVQEMDAEKEFEKLKSLYSEEIKDFMSSLVNGEAAVNVVFEREIIESFIDMTPPGIDEVMAIAAIIDSMDKGDFDLFILDTAPTGHLIRFLEMPELALDWLKFFFTLFLKYKSIFRMSRLSAFLVDLSKKIKRLLTVLRDGEQSLFVPIAIPTEMAYNETSDLLLAVKHLKIAVSQIILNMAHPNHRQNAVLGECALCTNRIAYEKMIFDTFKQLFPGEPLYRICRQEGEVTGIKALHHLGMELYG